MVEAIKGFVKELFSNPGKALRSAITTVVATASVLVALDVNPDYIVWTTTVLTVLRTLLAAIDPGNVEYGIKKKAG